MESVSVLELKLPEDTGSKRKPEPSSSLSARSAGLTNGYVQTHKAKMELRGLKYEDIFGQHRAQRRAQQPQDAEGGGAASLPNQRGTLKKPAGNAHRKGDNKASGTREAREKGSTGGGLQDTTPGRSILEERLIQVVNQYSETPGLKLKEKRNNSGRTLGNVVSAQRLCELLECPDPLRMENYHNLYP